MILAVHSRVKTKAFACPKDKISHATAQDWNITAKRVKFVSDFHLQKFPLLPDSPDFSSAFLTRRVKNWLKPSLTTMHHLYTGVPWLWNIVNRVPFLQRAAMRYVYLSKLSNAFQSRLHVNLIFKIFLTRPRSDGGLPSTLQHGLRLHHDRIALQHFVLRPQFTASSAKLSDTYGRGRQERTSRR